MCGIFVAATSELFDRASFSKFVELTDIVRHRGPNDSGYGTWSVKQARGDNDVHFDVFLGSRRLSILDLSSAGHQPMQDGKGRWIVFNGEIFNFLELRQELIQKGHCFNSGTDTEVLLHLYAEYGEAGFNKLNGMWAFAILDIPARRLVLSRDRFSMKPLYMLAKETQLFFASEIKQLLPLLPTRRLNVPIMSTFLVQGLVDHSSETFFSDITRIPSATSITINLDTWKVQEKTYWQLEPPVSYKDTELPAVFRHLLVDSIKLRLRSDVKVGVLLSGGLDSSVIALVTNQLRHGEAEAYSVISDDHRYSEEGFIDLLTAATNLRTTKIMFRPFHIAEALETALYYNDEPFGSLSVIAQYKLFEMIKRESDATVLLSGQGGDEILLGYLKFFFFYMRSLWRKQEYGRAFYEFCSSLGHGTAVRQFSIAAATRYNPFMNKSHSYVTSPFSPEPISSCGDLTQRQVLEIGKYSVPALARYEDRHSMAHSLEVRHPFLDHRLVSFALNLPVNAKIRQGWMKYILRDSFKELPEGIRWRKDKRSFTTPEEQWLKNELRSFVVETFQNSALEELQIIDGKQFLKHYEEFLQGRRIHFPDISRVLIAEMWTRRMLTAEETPFIGPAGRQLSESKVTANGV